MGRSSARGEMMKKVRKPLSAGEKAIYMAALQEFRSGENDAAVQDLAKLRILQPRWPRTQLLEAYLQRSQERYGSEAAVLRELIRYCDIEDREERCLAAEAHSMLGSALTALGRSREAVAEFMASVRLELSRQQRCIECSNAIFAANYIADYTAAEFAALYAAYRELLSDIMPYPAHSYHHAKLRIGYLSADCCEHAVAFFLMPLLKYRDRSGFAAYVYSATGPQDEVTAALRLVSDGWCDIRALSDKEAAARIYEDEIDILFDLGGHTKNNRLPVLAYHPAAYQMSGIGYMNSTGLRAVEYFLSDVYCQTGNNRSYFTERLLTMPKTHFCYEPLKKFPLVKHQPLGERQIVFGCFNNFRKVTDAMLRLWAEILCQVPGAKLLLKHQAFDSQEGCRAAGKRLAAAGIPLMRTVLQGFSAEYLDEYNNVDIALDTFPYTGGLTTVEALLMGVPVVSLYGGRHGTCFGLSLLANAGLPELAAASPPEYVARAVALARDRELLQLLHSRLRQMLQQSPLMDGRDYAHEAEKLYRTVLKA
jgi:predicted O-linked N-acetylglucosamine transferase (SPINDLY family)